MNEKFERIYNEIIENNGFDDDIVELWGTMLKSAIEYTNMRANWSLMTIKERVENDKHRISLHDSFINNSKMFARYCEQKERVLELKTFLEKIDRKEIGDFANYIVFKEAIKNR